MKALVLRSANAPFSLETVPDPTPGPGEAVVRVLACGSGLTIQHVKAGRAPVEFPRIIGHEITGEVVALGAGVTGTSGAAGLSEGDAVTAYFYLTCGHCKWCRIDRETLCENFGGFVGREVDGGYAEYMKLPAENFIRLPAGLDHRKHPAEIGVITDAVATPLKVIRRARVAAGETVAVFGAGGGLGIHMLMMARWAHARVIAVDTASNKLGACRDAGADEVVDASRDDPAEALMELTGGAGVDVAIDFVSSKQTLESGVASLGRGGRLVTLGGSGQEFTAPARDMLNKELELIGSRYATRQEVIESLELVARGAADGRSDRIWPLVTEIGTLETAESVHDKIENGLVTGRAALLIG
jgi:alcohol dehydrogenase, propanol-preferring